MGLIVEIGTQTHELQVEHVPLTKKAKKKKIKDGTLSLEVHKQPTSCPPCSVIVVRSCIGAHRVAKLKCCDDRRFDCGKTCEREREG